MANLMRFSLRTAAALCAAFALASCQDFFTTSLAEPLARDPADLIPTVTAGNAAELAAQVSNDPDASLVVLDGLETAIASASAAEVPALVALALEVTSNASGVGGALLESAGPIADLLMNGDFSDTSTQTDLFAIIDDSIAGLDNLGGSADTLTSIITDLTDGGSTLADITATASADDLAMAAVVLLANEASSSSYSGVEDYVDYLGSSPSLSASEQLAADLAEAAAAKYAAEGGTGPLADLLSSLNLTGA